MKNKIEKLKIKQEKTKNLKFTRFEQELGAW